MLKLNILHLCICQRSSKKYLLFFFLTVTILVYGFLFAKVEASTIVDSDIIENTTWTKDGSPYLISKNLYIREDAALTIDPGVLVKFIPNGSRYSKPTLYILGKIFVNGQDGDPVYFTSSYDDEVGGSTDDDYEDCYYESYDEDWSGIGEEICEMVDWYEPGAGDWGGIYFKNSTDSVFKNVFLRYANDAISFESSKVDFENLNISDGNSGLTEYNESTIKIINGSINNLENDAFTLYDNSSIDVSGVTIKNVDNGFTGYMSSTYKEEHPNITTFLNANISLLNVNLECQSDGVTVFNNYSLKINGGSISCLHNGVSLFNEVNADISGVKITNAQNAGVIAFNNTKPDTLKITNSDIFGNYEGFVIFNTNFFSANKNNIHNNLSYGVNTFSGIDLDFTANFWGGKTGPTHSSNALGKGDIISDNILYKPFLKVDPLKESISNIMFIPGFQASRLYQSVGDFSLGTGYEDKLWEPNTRGDVTDLNMTKVGGLINKKVYTKDVMSEAQVFGMGVIDFYKTFFMKLDEMVSNNEIVEWKSIPYDWRLSPLDVVERGVEDKDGNISYSEELKGDQIPYIIEQLQKLVDNSNNGKVTIITHSNGGLVAKALISKLIDMKDKGENDLIDHIDNLIAVASPFLGTPKATLGILHGYDQGMMFNLLLSRKKARDFGKNVPGAYGLLPSGKYVTNVNKDLILLDPSLDKLNNWRDKYGESIDTYNEFENFLLDIEGNRINPSYGDLVNPTILNETIFNSTKNLHEEIDNIVMPSNIKVSQIAGWGLPTANDLRYKSKNECTSLIKLFCFKKKAVLSSDAGFTSGGDGTVVGDSALFGDGEKYYLNLEKYNNDKQEGKIFYSGYEHANIFKVIYLYDLIHNILKKEASLPSYISRSVPSLPSYTILKMHSPVAIDIYDDKGLHTGVTEGENEEQNVIEQQIPNSIYMQIGEDKYIVVPKGGSYTLKLQGLEDGIFTLEEENIVDDIPSEPIVWIDIPTTELMRGELSIKDGSLATEISMDEDGDGVFESELKPVDMSIPEEKDQDTSGDISSSSSRGGSTILNYFKESKNQPIEDINNAIDKIAIKKSGGIVKIKNNPSVNFSKIVTKKDVNDDGSQSKGNVLGASVGASDTIIQNNIKIKIIVIGLLIVIFFGLKIIFKLI
ncbi:MAG: hypothetical protein WCI91_03675 [Candidatus Nomurabacteria bacterium]